MGALAKYWGDTLSTILPALGHYSKARASRLSLGQLAWAGMKVSEQGQAQFPIFSSGLCLSDSLSHEYLFFYYQYNQCNGEACDIAEIYVRPLEEAR